MHKHDEKSLLIKTLAEGYTITAACKRAGGSKGSSMPSAAMRVEGSALVSRLFTTGRLSGLTKGWASVAAVARRMGGMDVSPASVSNEGNAFAPCVMPACSVVPVWRRARQAVPYHLSIAAAAHSGFSLL